MSYDKHNLVQDFGYEIFRSDSSLRKRYMSDNKASCEGTLIIDTKDAKKRDICRIEQPVRSLVKNFVDAVFGVSGHRFATYPVSHDAYNIAGGMRQHGGIYLENKSGTAPNYSFGDPTGGVDNYTYSTTQGVSWLNYNATTGTIDTSIRRANFVNNTGSCNSVCVGINGNHGQPGVADDIIIAGAPGTLSWTPGTYIDVTYNFSFPTSARIALTKNFYTELFASYFPNNRQLRRTDNDGTTFNTTVSTGYYYSSTSASYFGYDRYYNNVGVNQIDRGIVLGSSGDPVSWEDYRLHSIIDPETLRPEAKLGILGQDFQYNLQYNGTKVFVWYARLFTNISENDVIVREAAVYAQNNSTGNSTMLARWLTEEDIVVHPHEVIKVYWKPTVIVS